MKAISRDVLVVLAAVLLGIGSAPTIAAGVSLEVDQQAWSDGETHFQLLAHGKEVAISGHDQRSVAFMNCRRVDGSTTNYACSGSGYNELGAFTLQSQLNVDKQQLRVQWSAEQDGKVITGESVLRPVSDF